MRKNILILLTLFCAVLFATPASALMKNEPADFRGIPWFASYKGKTGLNKLGFEKEEREGVITTFQRKNEKLQIGAAKLTAIEYLFLDNVGLVQVIVRVENTANVDALLSACTENWGEPRDGLISEIFSWYGKKIKAALWVYEGRDSADLFIHVKTVVDLIEEQEKLLTKSSQKDF